MAKFVSAAQVDRMSQKSGKLASYSTALDCRS